MKIEDYNQEFFKIIPESPKEKNELRKFPGFRLIKGTFYIPNKPVVARNIIERFKRLHKSPIDCTKNFIECLTTEQVLKEIPEDFPWINPPFKHQELALRFLYTHGSAGLLLEPGLGKTFVVLNYIKLKEFCKSLVICPKALLFVWEDEVAEHRPDLSVHIMEATDWTDKMINAEARLLKWTNALEGMDKSDSRYESSRANYLSAKRDVKNIPARRDKDIAAADEADIVVINYEKVSVGLDWLLSMNFDFMAIDEGLIKDMKAARTKAIHKLAGKIPFRTIMSGTLVNNGPLDVFSPIKIIEPSLSGSAYGAFEHYYAHIAKTRNGRRFVTGVGKRQTEEIRDTLAACSIVMTKEEWLPDLPDKHYHIIEVPMTEEQETIYNDLLSNHICKVGDKFMEVENPLTMANYLNQISNGFIYTREKETDIDDMFGEAYDGEWGPRETIFIDSLKKQKLRELINDQLSNKKLIVWYNFQAEYDQICEVFNEEGIDFLSIRGGSRNTGEIVHTYNRSGSIRPLVCQAQAVNYGITVLGKDPEALEKSGVTVMPDFDSRVYNHVFWAIPYSLERYIQQQDRSHRIGQKRDVHYWILQGQSGIERKIYERISLKRSVNEAILVDYIKSICG